MLDQNKHSNSNNDSSLDEQPNSSSGSNNWSSKIDAKATLWIHPLTRFHKIPVFKRVWIYLFLMGIYTSLVAWITDTNFPSKAISEAGGAACSSALLGLLLVFRTNTAYNSWLEGRKAWGQLVNDSRNFCLKVKAFVPVSQEERIRFGKLIVSFAYALKHHLRNTIPSEDLPGIGKFDPSVNKNLPVFVAGKIFENLQFWHQEGKIDDLRLIHLDEHVRAFMDVAGACERIKSSPLAVSYRAFMRQGIALNLLLLPWYVTPQYPLQWCLPLILVGTYFLIGLELIAEDIEDPFGQDGDDLPLDNICTNIKNTVSEILPLEKQLRFTQSIEKPRIDPLKSNPNA